MIKLVVCKKPKGYSDTKVYFNDKKIAEVYIKSMDDKYALKKLEALELPLSNRRKKMVMNSRPKKYVLTKVGNKFKLWKELN